MYSTTKPSCKHIFRSKKSYINCNKRRFIIKRPILVAVIGYILGILWGLYFEISIAPFYIPIIVIYLFKKTKIFNKSKKSKNFKLFSFKRYLRYLKLFIKFKIILIIIIFSTISNSIVLYQNKKYEILYQEKDIQLIGKIVSNKEEKEYSDVYKLKIIKSGDTNKFKNTKIYLRIKKTNGTQLEYGDIVKVEGIFEKPSKQRNEGGFDYSQYLKTIQIYGTVEVKNIEILNKENNIFTLANTVNLKIKEKIFRIFPEKEASIIQGLLLGDVSKIEEDIQENFRTSSIIHILAVSGMHVSYIIIGIHFLFSKILGKKATNILSIIFLLIYMFITGFSPSIVRAVIMGIIGVLSKLIYRRTDIYTSMAISLFIILFYNPFLIVNIGLQLSYLGTIGIIVFQKNVFNFIKRFKYKSKFIKYRIKENTVKIMEKFEEMLAVTISAQLVILPVMLVHFNYLGIYFLITNILASCIIGPILIFSILIVMISIINFRISKIFSYLVLIGIKLLIIISEFGQIPFAKLYVATPKMWQIVVYYIILILLNNFCLIKIKKNLNYTQIRLKNLLQVLKFKIRENKKKFKVVIILFVFIISTFRIMPKSLEINFIDVGQGDSTFIITPCNKTILIDGGGSLSNSFDVGEKTLLPFILDKGYTKIDTIIISHFDQDHIRTEYLQ